LPENAPLFFPPSRWRHLFAIVVLGFTAYATTLQVGFLWDDHIIIETNRSIQDWSLDNLKHDFISDNTQGTGDNYYRPLQALAHRIDYTLWKLNPFGYHLTDVLVHLANACLLYILIEMLGFSTFIAFMTASFFAVHPIGIEQFLVASGLTTPLSFFFSLSCIICLLRSGVRYAALGLGCFTLALLTKESSIVTPAWVALAFYLKQLPRKRAWVILPMGLLAALYLLLRQHNVHSVIGPLEPAMVVFFVSKVFFRIVWDYAALILWPWNLHSHRLIPHLSHIWAVYPLALLGLAIAAWRTRNRTALFCLGWMVAGLLPMIPVMMRGSFMLDHWGYTIALGVLLPLSLGIARGFSDTRSWVRQAAGCLFLGLVIFWSLLVHLNVELRGSDEKIYRWALRFTTSNPVKHNLGVLLIQTGRAYEAVPYLEEVRADYPEDADNTAILALAYWESGHRPLALRLLKDFEKHHPGNVRIQSALKRMKTSLSQK
jgi:hypothetical protein